LDQAAAARLHPHDLVRLVRAIEVAESSGRPLSAWQAEHAGRAPELPMRVIALTCERAALYARLDARGRAMLDAGLVDEVRALLQRYDANLAPLRSIGYREVAAHLCGAATLDAALASMQRATRQFAKRQMTWWRGDISVEWVDAERADAASIIASIHASD
ncbi:MAG: tRNA (adenosine(37)-N6)-dimethylallyltransferase, partial [Candidatus Binatia bacterium]